MISRAVVRECTSAFAGFSNCRHRNQPCVIGELDGFRQHAAALLGRGRQHHLRAEETQQLAALDAETFGHGDDERIALLRAHHRETDAGVAAGGFDDGLAGLQRAAAFGVFDDGAAPGGP